MGFEFCQAFRENIFKLLILLMIGWRRRKVGGRLTMIQFDVNMSHSDLLAAVSQDGDGCHGKFTDHGSCA